MMFAVDLPIGLFCGRSSGGKHRQNRWNGAAVEDVSADRDPQHLIRKVLAGMAPSTAEEIAAASRLDRAVVEPALERMAARCQVMFNPLTKRFSLPRTWSAGDHAA